MQRAKFMGLYLSDGTGAWDDGSSRGWLLNEFDKERDKDGNMDMRKRYTLIWNDPTDNTSSNAGKSALADKPGCGILFFRQSLWFQKSFKNGDRLR